MSGWPDPNEPGYPANPEQDGWHWIQTGGGTAPWYWLKDIDGDFGWETDDGIWSAANIVHSKAIYLGPCLTPSEVAALPVAVAGIVSSMKVEMADGYRLAAKVALAALEPADGVFYARDQGEHLNLKRAHHRVKQKLDEAAEAWNIDMEEKQ
jgi:hypothetical protein